MARIGFFADLADGSTVRTIDKADYDQGTRAMPRIYSPEHGWLRATRIVTLKSNPSLHECDTRCTHATGKTMQCECSCGGKNHGKHA